MASAVTSSQGVVHRHRMRSVLCNRTVMHFSRWHVRLPNPRFVRRLWLLFTLPHLLRVHINQLGIWRKPILRRSARYDWILSSYVVEILLDSDYADDLRCKYNQCKSLLSYRVGKYIKWNSSFPSSSSSCLKLYCG